MMRQGLDYGARHMNGRGPRGDYIGTNGFEVFLFILLLAVIAAGIVVLVAWLVRRNQGVAASTTAATAGAAAAISSPGAGGTPLDILNVRYARGEIDKAEYDEKKKDIGV